MKAPYVVVAPANGAEIVENAIWACIVGFRSAQGFESDDTWDEWLINDTEQ